MLDNAWVDSLSPWRRSDLNRELKVMELSAELWGDRDNLIRQLLAAAGSFSTAPISASLARARDGLGFRLMDLELDVSGAEANEVAVGKRLRGGDARTLQERAVGTAEIVHGHPARGNGDARMLA